MTDKLAAANVAIPILIDHDSSRVIGFVSVEDGKLIIRLEQSLSKVEFFDTFGNVGGLLLEAEPTPGKISEFADDLRFKVFQITNFSSNWS